MSARGGSVALRSRSFRSDRIAWLVFLLAVVLATAATRAWLHRRVRVEGAVTAPASPAFRLVVLAWGRVGTGARARQADAARVAEQLAALRGAGFTAVSLRQVHDAYHGGPPLPERAVLLTFDGGHLSTYEAVDPLLRRTGWPAVMFLDPQLEERRDATYVWWDRLDRMLDSGLWDVGTLGGGPDAARVVERRLDGHAVLASVSRPGPAAPAGAGPLAFETSLFGVNDASSDPRRLLRLVVPDAWSGRALVERLELSLAAPRAATCADAPPLGAGRWVLGAGALEVESGLVTLAGAPRAAAWLAGGEWAPDFVLEAEVRPERGAFWVVQQEVGSGEQWRWGGAGRWLYLERIRPGAPVEVVSSVELPSPPANAWHALRVVKRGDGVWAEWDGAPVAGLPRRVGAGWRRADVGIVTGSPADPGRLTLRNVRFAAIPYRVRDVSGSPTPREVESLLQDAACLAAIRPPAAAAAGAGPARAGGAVDRELLDMIAARGAWDVVPAAGAPGDVRAALPGGPR